jgi:hypothetical protein
MGLPCQVLKNGANSRWVSKTTLENSGESEGQEKIIKALILRASKA